MRVRKLTATNDMAFGNGQLDFYKDVPEGVGQIVKTSLLLFYGEWFLNNQDGCPYFQGILGKYSEANADVVIQDYVLNVQDVVGIKDFASNKNPDTRKLDVSFKLDTLYGPTAVQVLNYTAF